MVWCTRSNQTVEIVCGGGSAHNGTTSLMLHIQFDKGGHYIVRDPNDKCRMQPTLVKWEVRSIDDDDVSLGVNWDPPACLSVLTRITVGGLWSPSYPNLFGSSRSGSSSTPTRFIHSLLVERISSIQLDQKYSFLQTMREREWEWEMWWRSPSLLAWMSNTSS